MPQSLGKSGNFSSKARSNSRIWGDLSSIEMIGGGSRVPIFIRTVSEAFGMETQRTLNSSECIARGAGLFQP
uniref:Carbohydrate kinase FGGY C-terminal domain-containing protein n=1 Tax=Nymphaea colorata TaxID=210225 RepID=A0A5K1HQT6_9MAGN|nr:unnamed protein product [Nymphaea colorata]